MVVLDDSVRKLFDDSDKYFPTNIQKFQFYDKYSRFNYALGRRETWVETVSRAVSYLRELSQNKLSENDYNEIEKYILEMKAMPSMRLLAMAGDAARRQGISIYNCSYIPVESLEAYSEALIISMSGCGVGFSVERQYVSKLPHVLAQSGYVSDFIIEDSTEGWAEALLFGLNEWFNGRDVRFNYDLIRPAGAPLRVKGGRASGPEPLRRMIDFVRGKVLSRQGHHLSSLDAHDIMCAVGNAAVMGGTRRTAMISLFDYDDEEMLNCKSGDFETENSQRWNANNSAVIPSNISQADYVKFFNAMVQSGRGEPGIFSRDVANRLKPERRANAEFGVNPCGEILLRPYQFCNLSIAVARADDTLQTLSEKVRIATIIGTIQSMETNFKGLRPVWRINAEEERLLGVDITGQFDSAVARSPEVQRALREIAVSTNKVYAELLGIRQSAAVTCVKPSGNSSQLLNCSSGIHPRWSEYYVRNVRVGASTPIFKVLQSSKVPMHPENGQTFENAVTWVVHFPVRSPEGNAEFRENYSAIAQLEYWLSVKMNWTEHNPSITVSYRENEIIDILNWVWNHREFMNGVSFLPFSDAKYEQMPYVEITQTEYNKLVEEFPEIDFGLLHDFESEDLTTSSSELACVSGVCEIEYVPVPVG